MNDTLSKKQILAKKRKLSSFKSIYIHTSKQVDWNVCMHSAWKNCEGNDVREHASLLWKFSIHSELLKSWSWIAIKFRQLEAVGNSVALLSLSLSCWYCSLQDSSWTRHGETNIHASTLITRSRQDYNGNMSLPLHFRSQYTQASKGQW